MNLIDFEEIKFIIQQENLIQSGLESDCYLYDGYVYKIYSKNNNKNTPEYRMRKYDKVCILEKTLKKIPEAVIPEAIICNDSKTREAMGLCLPYRPNTQNLWDYLANQNISKIKEYYKKYADIIEQLNAAGWYWGDATPYNILVESNGQLHLIDLDSAGCKKYKNDCTNKLTNHYLIKNGVATKDQLRHYWCQNANYDHLTVLLAYLYQIYKEEYIDVIKNLSFQNIFDKDNITQIEHMLKAEEIL